MSPRATLLRVEEVDAAATGTLASDDLRAFFSAFGDVTAVRPTGDMGMAIVKLCPSKGWKGDSTGAEELVEAALSHHVIGDVEVLVSRWVDALPDQHVVSAHSGEGVPHYGGTGVDGREAAEPKDSNLGKPGWNSSSQAGWNMHR